MYQWRCHCKTKNVSKIQSICSVTQFWNGFFIHATSRFVGSLIHPFVVVMQFTWNTVQPLRLQNVRRKIIAHRIMCCMGLSRWLLDELLSSFGWSLLLCSENLVGGMRFIHIYPLNMSKHIKTFIRHQTRPR